MFFDASTSTPACILTFRTSFSPKKFLCIKSQSLSGCCALFYFVLPDLNLVHSSLRVGVNVDVDWEMCVDVSHLVLESLGDANDHVVDDGTDSTEGSDGLARTVVHLNVDERLGGLREGNRDVAEVLGELAY